MLNKTKNRTMNTMKRREFLKKTAVGFTGLFTGLSALAEIPNESGVGTILRAQPGLANAVPLPDGVLKGPASGYVTALNKNIGPVLDLTPVQDGLYVGKYKHGGKFYPLDGQIEDGRLGCTVKLYGGKSKMDFFIEVDDRGPVWYLASESPEKAREIRFSPEVEKCLYPLRWESANKQHTPWKKRHHHTAALPHGVILEMNWIPGDVSKQIPDFWIGRYEVTQEQYQAIMGTNPSRFRGTDLPVEGVSWHNAMTFCDKLTAIEKATGRLPTGYKYTLPTEGQREYACRAGTTGDYNVDGVELSELAWYDANSGGTTHPVGQKKPNAWGLYDMHGNVFEWCLDWLKVGEERVMRGGSWFHNANYCRSASRSGGPDGWHSYRGFRVVLVPVK